MSISESEKTWVIYYENDAYGPLSAIEIKKAFQENKLKSDDCVWKKGWKRWKQFENIPAYAFECKKSPGNGKEIPELPIPDAKDFESIISPNVTSQDLYTESNWDARRLAIVGGSFLIGGVAGAAIAGGLTAKNKDKELEKNEKYITKK